MRDCLQGAVNYFPMRCLKGSFKMVRRCMLELGWGVLRLGFRKCRVWRSNSQRMWGYERKDWSFGMGLHGSQHLPSLSLSRPFCRHRHQLHDQHTARLFEDQRGKKRERVITDSAAIKVIKQPWIRKISFSTNAFRLHFDTCSDCTYQYNH